jgi:hypothetical protein
MLISLTLRNSTGLRDYFTAVKDLLQSDGPIGNAVRKASSSSFQEALSYAGPLVLQVGEALPYVKQVIPILMTLVDMYHEQENMAEEHEALKKNLIQIQVLQCIVLYSGSSLPLLRNAPHFCTQHDEVSHAGLSYKSLADVELTHSCAYNEHHRALTAFLQS